MRQEIFAKHTPDDAPDGAGAYLAGAERQFGFVPDPMARMAASKAVIEGFLAASAAFERSTAFLPLEREVIAMTVGRINGCHYCVAMHSALLAGMDAPGPLVDALRSGAPIDDARLDALARFARDVVERRGQATDQAIEAFLAAGYTARHALDVVLGAGVYAITTYANRLTGAELDPAFEAFRWSPPAEAG